MTKGIIYFVVESRLVKRWWFRSEFKGWLYRLNVFLLSGLWEPSPLTCSLRERKLINGDTRKEVPAINQVTTNLVSV